MMGKIRLGLVLIPVIASGLLFTTLAVIMWNDPHWPFGLGLLETEGPEGLWVALPMVVLALGGTVLVLIRQPLGAWLLIIHSSVWIVSLLGAVAWDAIRAFTSGAESLPEDWTALVMTSLTLSLVFFLIIVWAWPRALQRCRAAS